MFWLLRVRVVTVLGLVRLRIVSCLRVPGVLARRVWSGCVLPCTVFAQALPLLTPRDRVSGSCGLTVWSGHAVWSYGVVVCLVIAGFVSYRIVSYRIVCARSGRTLGARSGRDNITV